MRHDQTIEAKITGLLKNRTIAIAESCTGGLLSNRLTDIPGISKNLLLSVVAYSNNAKMALLDIPHKMIKRHGAVSAAVAKAMARGVQDLANTNIGVGITGIAGPGGGTKAKPVGLVYIALSTRGKIMHKKCLFKGGRKSVKYQATQAALVLLLRYVEQM